MEDIAPLSGLLGDTALTSGLLEDATHPSGFVVDVAEPSLGLFSSHWLHSGHLSVLVVHLDVALPLYRGDCSTSLVMWSAH